MKTLFYILLITSVLDAQSKIGSIVNVGNFQYQVYSLNFIKTIGDELYSETANGVFMIINLSVKNISKTTRTLDNSFFAIYDNNGNKYEYSEEGTTALEMSGSESNFLKDLHPNIPVNIKLVFEVPKRNGSYILEVSGGFWSLKSQKIKLIN